jgi:hypothetical protein
MSQQTTRRAKFHPGQIVATPGADTCVSGVENPMALLHE